MVATNALSGTDPSTGAQVAGGAVGAAVEGTTAWLVLRRTPVTAGAAHTLASASDYGLLSAWGLAHLGNLTDQERMAVALAGAGIGGVVGGALWVPRRPDITWGDAEVARAAAVAGAIAGATVGVAADPNPDDSDHDGVAISTVVGGTLGLLIGDRLVRETRFDAKSGVTVDFSMLFGAICPALVVGNTSPEQDETYSLLIGAGAMAGWIVAYVTERGHISSANRHSMSMRVNPLALAMLPLLDAHAERAGGVAQGSMATELAHVRMCF